MTWRPVVELADDGGELPLFARIAEAIAGDIARGRLRPGQKLPGSRRLATDIGVNRGTVNAALAELAAQGWIAVQPARGAIVRPLDPAGSPGLARATGATGTTSATGQTGARATAAVSWPRVRRACVTPRAGMPRRAAYPLPPVASTEIGAGEGEGELVLSGGTPDPRLFPGAVLARAYRRVISRRADHVLDYGDARGHPRLRAALAEMLADARGLACGPGDLVVTRGSQMALWLIAHVLIRPGDRVAVEAYGYQPAWDALRSQGAELCPVAVDGDGVVTDDLEALLADGPLRAAYVTPHHQYPTMVVMSPARRARLLSLARAHRFAVIEDDYDNEYHYEGRPVLPLASGDRAGSVVYVGTLSKVLAPGLRIGYVVAPRPVLERLAAARTYVDRQGDLAAEAAIAELLEDGEIQRHARRTRRVYRARRDALVGALETQLCDRVSFAVPAGGMALWVEAARGIDVDAWAARARERGVLFTTGRQLAFDRRPRPYARIGFARVDEAEIARAVAIMAGALP